MLPSWRQSVEREETEKAGSLEEAVVAKQNDVQMVQRVQLMQLMQPIKLLQAY